MGVITLVLVAAGLQSSGDSIQPWVIVSAALAIAIGTYSGGWRIIRTMGTGLAEIRPAQGLAAETATGVTILASSNLGFALSTTQVASGGVIGAGLGRRGGTVRWQKANQILIGWLFTLPAAGLVGAASAALTLIGPIGLFLDGLVTIAFIIGIFQISRRNKIHHGNVLSEVEGASEIVMSAKEVRAAEKKAVAKAKKLAKKAKEKAAKKGKK